MTHEPVRLLNDPALGAALRRDLGAVTRVDAGYDVAAGLARFEGNLAAGTAVAKTSAGLPGGVVAAGALLVTGGLAAALLLWPSGSEDTRAPIAATSSISAPSAPISTPVVAPAPLPAPTVAAPESDAVELVDDPAPSANKPQRRRARSADTTADHDPQPGPATTDVLREARNLQAARSQLGRDAAKALALAESGAAEFKGGTFAQEWEGVAILALFELGRPESRARGEDFLRRHPSGTYAQRVRQALGN